MHAILVPFGSAGDVYPFLGLGAELRRRGHRVTMITAGYFEDLARKAGFEFAPFTSREIYLDVIGNPDLWHPQRSVPWLAKRSVIPAIAVVYRLIAERYRPGETAVVAVSLALGARVAQEKLGVPLTTMHLQPVVFRSRFEPPIHPGLGWIRQGPVALRPAVFRLMDFMVDKIYAGPLNAFRAEPGLAPVKRVMDQWWHSPQSTLALFPKWYAAPQPDWPPQVRFLDFPMYDGGSLEAVSPGLQAYLENGEPPIVFTSGSAMATGKEFSRLQPPPPRSSGGAPLWSPSLRISCPSPSRRTCITLNTRRSALCCLVQRPSCTTAALVFQLRPCAPVCRSWSRPAVTTSSITPRAWSDWASALPCRASAIPPLTSRRRWPSCWPTPATAARCAAHIGNGDGIAAAVDVIEQYWGQRVAPVQSTAAA